MRHPTGYPVPWGAGGGLAATSPSTVTLTSGFLMSIRREPREGCDHGVVTDKTLPHDVGFQFGDQDSTGVVIENLLSMSILNPTLARSRLR